METGGVLPLAEALTRYEDSRIVLYHRVSGRKQGASGKIDEKTAAVYREMRKVTDRRLVRVVCAVEEGKLSTPRPALREAASVAAERGCLLVTVDLSRLIRAEAYDRQRNRDAWPTVAEFGGLRELTLGVPLATVVSPLLSEDERHSLAVKRGNPGRPRSIDDALAEEIFRALGYWCFDETGQNHYQQPLCQVAGDFGRSAQSIIREMARPCPHLPGKTWRDWLVTRAVEKGLLVVEADGSIVSKVAGRSPRGSRGWWGKPGRPPRWAVRAPK